MNKKSFFTIAGMLKWSCPVLMCMLKLVESWEEKKSCAEAIFVLISILQPGYS